MSEPTNPSSLAAIPAKPETPPVIPAGSVPVLAPIMGIPVPAPAPAPPPAAGARPAAARKPSPRIAHVNYDQCTGCEACIAVSPWDVCLVRLSEHPLTSHVKVDPNVCTGCTLCVKICPWDAIVMIPRPNP